MLVLADWSNIANICWHPAASAFQEGQDELDVHLKDCLVCREPGSTCRNKPDPIPVEQLYFDNLGLKLGGLANVLGLGANLWTFCLDGVAEEKFKAYPAYKGNRDKGRFDPRPLGESILREKLAPKARWVRSPKHEADDTIATLATEASEAAQAFVVLSSDKDLWVLLSLPGCRVYSPSHRSWVDSDMIAKAFDGLKDPRSITLHKTLWGDAGDNIPNACPRMQRQMLPIIKASDGTLTDMLGKTDVFDLSARCIELLNQNMRQLVINWRLVNLKTDVPLEWNP
jgi:5'-3' exonuclease